MAKKRDNLRTGGEILVDCLRIHGADMAFGVPGESYLPVLDALYDAPEIDFLVCRQEGGAAMMADAYGKLTGRPGICFVTRAPGATNASAGVHIAFQDSTPMILFVGQVARGVQEREAFQEIDYRRMYGEMSKWVAQIDDPARIPEHVSHAYHLATSGRPGPVVLAIPQDMLAERAAAPASGCYREIEAYPSPADMASLRRLLAEAGSPIAILGGGGWNSQACDDFGAFALANQLPITASFRCQDRMNNTHPNYVGDVGVGLNPRLEARIRDADLLLVIGARLGEITTGGYKLIEIPRPAQTLVHVYPGAEELGRVYQPDLPINAEMKAFARVARAMQPVTATWAEQTAAARADYLAWIEPVDSPGALQMSEVVKWLRENTPPETIVCNGAGNYSVWPNRFYQYRGYGTILAPTAGSMGYGTPAAVAAKRLYPERTVIAFAGDGCFLMNGQELATAVQYELPIIVLVVNNGMYGTIRAQQERDYPGRVSGTGLTNPDFGALARAYGGHGETVERTEEFVPAFERAEKSGKPAVIELRIDPEAVSPKASLSEIRANALEAKGG